MSVRVIGPVPEGWREQALAKLDLCRVLADAAPPGDPRITDLRVREARLRLAVEVVDAVAVRRDGGRAG